MSVWESNVSWKSRNNQCDSICVASVKGKYFSWEIQQHSICVKKQQQLSQCQAWVTSHMYFHLNSVFSKEVCESNIIMCPRCDHTCNVWWLSDTCSYAKVISSLFAFVHWLISTSRVWICQDLLCRAVCLEEKEWSLHWKEHHASL